MRKEKALFIFLSFFSFFLSQCGVGQSAEFSAQSTSQESQGFPTSFIAGDEINELTLEDKEISLPIHSTTDDSALVLVGLSDNSSIQGFEINHKLSSSSHLISSYLTHQNKKAETPHDLLRDIERHLPSDAGSLPIPSLRLLTQQGDKRSFKVISSFSSGANYKIVDAVLSYAGENFDLYIDQRDLDNLTLEDVLQVAENFDHIIPKERELFGDESDIDSDGKFAVLLTREINAIGEKYGGIVTGFFYAKDLYDASLYDSSNEMEIFYAMVPDAKGDLGPRVSEELYFSNLFPAVLVHEFQHMINYNQKRFLHNKSSEAAWLNEALSHLAEDIYSTDDKNYMAYSGVENPSRVAKYLRNIDKICITCGTSLEERGGAYLFLRYLYEQAELGNLPYAQSGQDFLSLLMDGSFQGIENINYALTGDSSKHTSFHEFLGRFALAVYLSNTPAATQEILKFSGLNLRRPQLDNRGTVLNGPAVIQSPELPYIDTLEGHSLTFIELSTTAEHPQPSLSFQNSSKFKAFLVQ